MTCCDTFEGSSLLKQSWASCHGNWNAQGSQAREAHVVDDGRRMQLDNLAGSDNLSHSHTRCSLIPSPFRALTFPPISTPPPGSPQGDGHLIQGAPLAPDNVWGTSVGPKVLPLSSAKCGCCSPTHPRPNDGGLKGQLGCQASQVGRRGQQSCPPWASQSIAPSSVLPCET